MTTLPVGPTWRTLRKICNTYLFTTQKIDSNQDIRRNKIQELLEGVRQNAREGKVVDIGRVAFRTSYSVLINEGNGEVSMDLHLIKYLFLDLFVAGTDTTSSTLEWAMVELLRNPKTFAKAREELNQTIGKDNHLQESDILRLPYLQAILKETFRLHPAIPLLLPRKAGADVEVCGFTVPKGAQIMVNAWAIGRDPTIWDNPNSFMPERLMGSEIDVGGNNFELIPFGGGRRICPGLPLAMRMLHMMLGSLVHWFNWKLVDGVDPMSLDMEEKFGITLQKAKPLIAFPTPT
ncbi:Cytochrome P450 76C4 [Linum perenne]